MCCSLKGLDTAVATSRQQHAANVEAAHEAREAYLKKACFCSRSSALPLLHLLAYSIASVTGAYDSSARVSCMRDVDVHGLHSSVRGSCA